MQKRFCVTQLNCDRRTSFPSSMCSTCSLARGLILDEQGRACQRRQDLATAIKFQACISRGYRSWQSCANQKVDVNHCSRHFQRVEPYRRTERPNISHSHGVLD